jgi:hypothetical protein
MQHVLGMQEYSLFPKCVQYTFSFFRIQYPLGKNKFLNIKLYFINIYLNRDRCDSL